MQHWRTTTKIDPMTPAALGHIATPDHRAARIGQDLLDRGATAVDAVVAASAALCAVYPQNVTLGGDTWTLVAPAGAAPVAINGTGRSPADLSAQQLQDRGYRAVPGVGPHSITVPGLVAAWGEMHDQWGRTPFADVIAPAVELARSSMIAPALARDLEQQADHLRADPGCAQVFFDADGSVLAIGDELRQPELADTLERIGAEGPATFYGGDVGRRYAAGLRQAGSMISTDDLTQHRTERVAPIAVRFGDVDVLTTPPNSQGFTLLKILRLMEQLELTDPSAPEQVKLIMEVVALAGQERDRLLADPDFVDVPVEMILDDATVEQHVADLRQGRRGSHLPAPTPPLGGDTIAIVATDADGGWVSSVQSVAGTFGSRVLEPSTGILAHNRGSGFSLDPNHPGYLEGGRRPPHTLMPSLVRRDRRVVGALATMGGKNQPFILAQVLCRILAGDHPQQAINAPRWMVQRTDDADRLIVADERLPDPLLTELAASATTEVTAMVDNRMGHCHAIWETEAGPLVGTDPRADGRPANAADR